LFHFALAKFYTPVAECWN